MEGVILSVVCDSVLTPGLSGQEMEMLGYGSATQEAEFLKQFFQVFPNSMLPHRQLSSLSYVGLTVGHKQIVATERKVEETLVVVG